MRYSRHTDGLIVFGKKFKEVRLRQNLTQDQLAYESGISKNQISRIERGEISTGVSNLFILAAIMHVHPKELFDFEWD